MGGSRACFPCIPRISSSACSALLLARDSRQEIENLDYLARAADLPERFREKTWVEPVLTIRRTDGTVHPEYSAIKLSFGFPP